MGGNLLSLANGFYTSTSATTTPCWTWQSHKHIPQWLQIHWNWVRVYFWCYLLAPHHFHSPPPPDWTWQRYAAEQDAPYQEGAWWYPYRVHYAGSYVRHNLQQREQVGWEIQRSLASGRQKMGCAETSPASPSCHPNEGAPLACWDESPSSPFTQTLHNRSIVNLRNTWQFVISFVPSLYSCS